MDVELIRRVEALRRPLELAAADNFAGVRAVPQLGLALRAGCDGVLARAPSDAMAEWRMDLARWELLDQDEQAIQVAKGMRLLARFPRPKRIALEPDADPMAASPETLPGIGPALAEKMAERGLMTVEDLLWLLPRRYDDVRDARPLAEVGSLEEGTRATFVARVTSSRMVFARGRRWAEVKLAELSGPPASATVRWFNVWAGIDKRMPAGCEVVLSGAVKSRGGRVELANPDILGITIGGRARQVRARDHGALSGRPGRSTGERAQGMRRRVRAHRGGGR